MSMYQTQTNEAQKDLDVNLVGPIKISPSTRTGSASFNVVNNKSGLGFVVSVIPGPATGIGPTDKAADAGWLSVDGEDQFMVTNNGLHQFTFKIDATKAPKLDHDQTYYFKVTADSFDNPGTHWGEANPVPFTVPGIRHDPLTKWLVLAAVGVLAIGLASWLLFRPTMVKVPDGVVGASVADATKRLTDAHFAVNPKPTPQPSTQPVDTVLAISPAPDKEGRLTKGATIDLTVAATPTADLPDVKGKAVADATKLLQDKKFKIKTPLTYRQSPSPADTILDMTPAAGSQPEGTVVELVVASAVPAVQKMVNLPSTVHMSQTDAMNTLRDLGFAPRVRFQADRGPSGVVLAQDVSGGQHVVGTVVNLTVSSAVPKVMVPHDLVGKSVADAERMIRQAGFTVIVPRPMPSGNAANEVLNVNPGPGSMVDPTTPIQVMFAIPVHH